MLESNPTYVTSREFRLQFLRSERFHPKLAAKRLIKHFKMKQFLFGSGTNDCGAGLDLMGRDVQVSDLTDEEQDLVRQRSCTTASSSSAVAKAKTEEVAALNESDGIVGHVSSQDKSKDTSSTTTSSVNGPSFRFLPERDHAGRDIIFDRPSQVNYNDIKSEVRTLFWFLFAPP